MVGIQVNSLLVVAKKCFGNAGNFTDGKQLLAAGQLEILGALTVQIKEF
jgi:hypothetical protein